ncbi:PstS family phosphate ABC transporter substrate-binding protein [Gracilibacillus kekensis]|uniref:Phosphate transport system substrate-binding protein n=1 Tax=Gracilibacillus kekensis TaxID=1027249 RepID=A0A1M7MKE1_9BACI|nr:substrate-binding domain-containing protein [Gracilibacillus kekensis]SHM90921.1 phosphate transport system substrate-binding protein [Gracilibacillus kekensis]
MRLLASILIVLGIGFAGLFLWIITLFGKDQQFYGTYIPILSLGLIVIIILAIYDKWKKKAVKVVSISFLVVATVTVATYEGYQYYLKSLEIVSTQDVDLSEYQPFQKDTRAISLEEESTLQLTDDLPQLDGATALYPVYAGFAQAVYPEKTYNLDESEVISSQTSNAFKNVIHSDADIAFMAEPSEKQYEFADSLNVDIELTPIGKEAFVFFVNKNNPVESLTIEQIQAIYSGEVTNWQDVGGNNEEIRAFQRPEGSGSQSALIRFMDNRELMEPPADEIVSGMGGIIRETSNYQNHKNAIGFSFRFFSQEMVENGEIKHIAINGIEPTKENIQNEKYPVIAEFYAVTRSTTSENVEKLINWIQTKQGQEIVDRTGYVSFK